MDLALQFDNACTAKDDFRKAYEKCNDIPQESRALIDTFLKEESDKDYEINLSITRVKTPTTTQKPVRIIPGPAGIVQATKLLKQTDILLGWKGAVKNTREKDKIKTKPDQIKQKTGSVAKPGKVKSSLSQ
nr:hypothetical protein [Tanacetum cinerariifolium]